MLVERPQNAYELANLIRRRDLVKLLKVSQPAVYKNCKRLFHLGFLEGKKVRSGESPEKTTYSVNRKVKKREFFFGSYFYCIGKK